MERGIILSRSAASCPCLLSLFSDAKSSQAAVRAWLDAISISNGTREAEERPERSGADVYPRTDVSLQQKPSSHLDQSARIEIATTVFEETRKLWAGSDEETS